MKPLKDASEGTGTLRGAALALAGVTAELIADATGSKAARRIVERIDQQFDTEEEDQ